MTNAGSRPAPTPEALLEAFRRSGDPGDLAALFDATAPGLFRLALHLVPDAATAEDVLQETFLVVLEHAATWDPERPALPWMNGILRNQAGLARRRAARRPDPDRLPPREGPADPLLLAAEGEERERLHGAMLRLPEPYRGVALLRWRYGMDPAAIAEVRDEPPGTVRSLLHRALKRLRFEMGVLPALLLLFGKERGMEQVRGALVRRAAAKAAAAGAAGGAAAAAGGVLLMKTVIGAAGVVVVVGASIGWLLLRGGSSEAPLTVAGAPPALPVETPPPAAPPAGTPPAAPPARTAAPPTDAPPSYDPSLATATLRVRVRLVGDPPKMRPVRFDADPECGKQQRETVLEETVVCRDGALANVVVHATSGTDRWTYEAPAEPVLLVQKGCMYQPHVFTVMTGQDIVIRNSDPVMHNVHAVPRTNREFNLSQLKGSADILKRLPRPEMGVRFKCDVHGWMSAFACSFDHPFHGVTDEAGTMTLRLPPGTWGIASWHEKLPAPEAQTVTLAAGETKEMEFVYGAK